jgi:hypothetical protein
MFVRDSGKALDAKTPLLPHHFCFAWALRKAGKTPQQTEAIDLCLHDALIRNLVFFVLFAAKDVIVKTQLGTERCTAMNH